MTDNAARAVLQHAVGGKNAPKRRPPWAMKNATTILTECRRI